MDKGRRLQIQVCEDLLTSVSIHVHLHKIACCWSHIYLYAVLHSDRTTSARGLELHVPFLDKYFTSYYFSLPAKDHQPQNGVEKHSVLQQACSRTGLLPDEILWRPKEAFSDCVPSIKKNHGILSTARTCG